MDKIQQPDSEHVNIPVDSPNGPLPGTTPGMPPRKPRRTLLALLLLLLAILLGVLGYFIYTTYLRPAPAATEIKTSTPKKTADKPATSPVTCGASETMFADKAVGMAFCYSTEWGSATVTDARVAPADTGHRQAIVFSAMPLFAVGGTSDDWSTTVGRGVGCLEPNNVVPPLSEYNLDWHGIVGSGMDVNYAQRSLAVTTGGVDLTETVSDLEQSGVCAQGHRVISGSRYRVAFAAFYRTFAEASGITTPRAHMDHPDVLFSVAQRAQLNGVLASIAAY